ncbi:unnamed protein product [Protopolystoma xenopodis]|uniref:Uncharacterized protein n=1 Tax=Protopolystoma xenopodis TaxID=117903 RepID=A0A448XGV6_9PLAT|nr:unnamed protein product [Protopolystoma xenopodis]
MTDEGSARIHRDLRAVRRGSIRTNLQPQLQGDPPPSTAAVSSHLKPDPNLHFSTSRCCHLLNQNLYRALGASPSGLPAYHSLWRLPAISGDDSKVI